MSPTINPDHLRRHLARRERRQLAEPSLRPSAVLVPLLLKAAGPHLVLTKRTAHLSHHASQICFPGGRVEPQDPDLLAAALRESQEEVGIVPEHVDV
ncbi:MAG: NUDIX hydrolase, partial [Candidatus Sericytochromatia bacterium]